MSIQGVSSSVVPSPHFGWTYDVFLSFRGEDTRQSFTDHLYAALKRKRIFVFRDDNELKRGKSIRPELFKAIEESRFSIIVFSKNYAYSTWCLDELVKIVEHKYASDQQMVFPIFYDVNPTVVRKQIDDFQKAFAQHANAFRGNIEKVQKWRKALNEVANISGWELKDRSESEFIEDIAMKISSKLISNIFETQKKVVGINSLLDELMPLLDKRFDDVRIVGIWGMGGLGKTTIARVIYDLISWQFEGSSFLVDVRENSENGSMTTLQKQLLCELLDLRNCNTWNVHEGIKMIRSRLRRKKVFLVIDDVVEIKQLEYLVGNRDWFGSGSKVLITSRDKHLLKTHGVDKVFELGKLNFDESRLLFCMKAFKSHDPMEGYEHLSKLLIEYANGLPLALIVLGSFLYDKTVEEWKSALERLKSDSEDKILNVLKISFDGLQKKEKKIFLDVACFFKGKDRDYVVKILEACDFNPVIGIRILIDKSLISIENNKLWMHDLLQEMGRQIVMRESEKLEKRSRLWKEEDICHVLSEKTECKAVEAIYMTSRSKTLEEDKHVPSLAEMKLRAKAFSKMTNLRLLYISDTELPEGLEYLPNELRLFQWRGYPLKSLPSNFDMHKIVEFDLSFSCIEQIRIGSTRLNNLRFMRFQHSQNLVITPDFTRIPNLEMLILKGCTRLREIHASLFTHKKLMVLNLEDCTSLRSFPSKIAMESLKELVLSGCSNMRNFPEIVLSMECLSKLRLDGTAIKELPPSIELLSGLDLLSLENCKNIESLPSIIVNGLKCLRELNLSGCSKLRKLPEIEGRMECLTVLHLNGTAIEELPLSVELLSKLAFLDLSNCKNLARLPGTVIALKSLETLILSGCSKLRKFPEIEGRMECLTELHLDGSAIEELPLSVDLLTKLAFLDLSNCNDLATLPRTLNGLKCLKTLNLSGCSRLLENVPQNLDKAENLEELDISGTAIRKPGSSISLLNNLKTLFRRCKGPPASTSWCSRFPFKLMPKRNLDPTGLVLPSLLTGLSSLTELDLSDCNLIEGAIPTDMCNLVSLEKLNLSRNNFVSLPETISCLPKLLCLMLEDCKSLQSLTKFPSNAMRVRVDGCASLERVPDTLKSCNSTSLSFCFLNCSKLLGSKNLEFSMLERFLEAESNPSTTFNIVVPGNKIPEWFKYQNEGSTITIMRPPYSYYNDNKSKLVGYAICCVFHVQKHQPIGERCGRLSRTHGLRCYITADQRESNFSYFTEFDNELGQPMSDHLWLLHWSNQKLKYSPWNFKSDHVELSFRAFWGRGLKVERCGVHPIYVDETEEFNNKTKEWRSMVNVAISSKRKLIEHAGAKASLSNDEPQRKRFKEVE
ncbi:putative Disease resistance protein [Melia azedarach]|uniref:Disease resistance protein n=1 Tax=Melia azedarach TaxID=155640 RepID=A0ACC1Y1A5_MELAZ|nr:putative Disease resistance protein [Melia azedarach]